MGNVMNLGRLLSDTARRLPDRTALVWGAQSWSWTETDARVDALVAALRQRGIVKGDPILVQARNSNQLFESLWAAFKLGAVWVPTNYRLTPPEVAYLATASGAKALIYDDAFPAHADAVQAASKMLKLIVAIGQPRADELSFDGLVADALGASEPEAEVDHGDPCWFFYTSGTTGRPKAAVLTHGQLAFVVNNHLADLMPGTGPDDASLVVAPLSHGAGAHALSQVARGAKSVMLAGDRFDEEEVWRLVQEHRITNMFTVPTILTRMVRHPAVDHFDHSSLRYVIYAGAPMYRADQKEALEKLGKVIVQYYGLGEVTGNITVLPREAHSLDDDAMPVGSCGFARTGMEIAIKDAEGKRLGAGEQGEICVRGPAVFAGYHDNPEANAKALKDGWFHTGDLGRLDERGFLYITGRASDMYISGGSNVYPREAEEVLLTHPAVAEVAILGVPDPEWGETGIAVVVLEAGQAADEAELLAFLKDKLARYKQPRRVFFWAELPKSGYGKVPKHLIRNELFARGDLAEVAAQ
ncbi:AMP-binding protein [Pelagibius litoralis]|uniref:AMP-binding protein n=1 Tax=Pelagibius litoralis TaxID=374515 RepID=A0A967F0P6_9PROT|nr:acyl-CoA synthetase [Pelagibius litoralis]NIA70864.1 AMP-binding protein [Pelagibius litoralis]